MRAIPGVLLLIVLQLPAVASGQSLELFGSGGPTITDTGNSYAAGAGFSPTSRMTILFTVERTHLSSRMERHGDVISSFRGGTLVLGTGELQVTAFRWGRFEPYGLGGLAAGVSRPNVNATFPDRVTNQVRAMFVGGGVKMRVAERLTLFVDARMMFGAEGNEGIVAVAPLRAGIGWRF